MKKALSVLLILLLLSGSASAMTVAQFVERYNDNKGEGSPVIADEFYLINDVAVLTKSELRDVVCVTIIPGSAEKLEDCTITSAALKHKPRCNTSVFLTNIAAAVSAVYPEIPEQERFAEIVRTLRQSEYYFGNSYWPEAPIPYTTEHMGQFVYFEETDYYTFLFSFSQDQP